MRLLLSTPCCIKKAKLSAANLILFDKLTHVYRGIQASNLCPKSMQQPGLLGQGLSIAFGMAAAKKQRGESQRVFAIIGDGEMHEGQIWETLQQAGHMKMDNLVAIIDYNGFSSHGPR
ncbi:transketolase N-terminal section [Citrobacter freundii]|nr:transketolase N-terminal section [Citrobacter freundii]